MADENGVRKESGEYQDIEVEVTPGGVMYLSFNRPERLNALTFEMLAEVEDALRQAAANGAVRCLVLQGRGRAFCAGDNIKGQGDLGDDLDPFSRYLEVGYVHIIKAIRSLPKPVIAKVQGHAMGAGLELALSADIRIVARDATLGIPFITIAGTGGTYQLTRMIGPTKTLEMLFTGRRLTGDEALAYGIATEAVDPDELDRRTEEWAVRLCALPTRVMGLMKRAVYRASEQSLDEGLQESAVNALLTHFLADRAEGAAAWIERRPPQFTNGLRRPTDDAASAR
jgi:2-(1,2-epoxy-1,2-dihydrophenyl)acetyl-CoA isomerase